MAKILFVDDDDELLSVVSASLTKEGHQVELCYTKTEAKDAIKLSSFDIIILDVTLPDGSGFDICRDFRASGGTTPILMLTGKDSERDKEFGLDIGADDYLTKPFGFRELSARLRALLRRGRDVVPQTLEMKGLVIDLNQHKVFRNGQEIRLQPLDYKLLGFFARNPNQILTQETILRRVWESYSESGIEALRAAVKRIRKEIDTQGEESLIETLHKVGYTFKPRS